jgi:hypothetical protein
MVKILNLKRYFAIGLIIFMYFLYILLPILISSLYQFRCADPFLNFLIFIQFYIANLFIIFLTFSLTIIDLFIINFHNLIKCKLYKIFVEDDPYYFKSENILFIISFIMFLFYGVADLSLIFLANPYYKLIDNVMFFFYLFYISFFHFTFITIVTLFSLCQRKREQKKDFLEKIIENEFLFNLLLKFSIKEWSSENVLILKDIDHFKKIIEFNMKIEYSKFIENNYLNYTLSPMEVNIDHSSIQSFKLKLKDLKEENINFLFDEVENSIKKNLDDTLMRFQYSSEYISFEKNQKNISL